VRGGGFRHQAISAADVVAGKLAHLLV
jgi:hypothetical protein